VLSLALERLIDEGRRDILRSVGEVLVAYIYNKQASLWQVFRASRAIFDLVRTPATDAIKQHAVDALAESELEVFAPLVWEQERTLALLPWPAARTFLYHLILDENGYNWREKEVYDEHRRQRLSLTTKSGASKVVSELFEEFPKEADAFLIGLLSDETRLSYEHERRSSASEGTVSAFALCMLWLFRDKIGLQKLFSDVLLPGKPGYLSLYSAFVDDCPQQLLPMLTDLGTKIEVDQIDHVRAMWSTLLRSPKIALEARAPAERFYEFALGATRGYGLNYLLQDIDTFGLLDNATSEQLLGILGSHLDASSLVASLKAGRLDLSAAIDFAKRANKYADFIYELMAGYENVRSLAPLKSIMEMLNEAGFRMLVDCGKGRRSLEHLLYMVRFEEANESGLLRELQELLPASDGKLAVNLMYVAFSQTSEGDDENKLRLWLAVQICWLPAAITLDVDMLIGGLICTPELFAINPNAVFHVLDAVTAKDFLGGVMSGGGRAHSDLVVQFVARLQERYVAAGEPEQIALLDRFRRNWDQLGKNSQNLYKAALDTVLDI
jgi:hypothetical protein